MKKIIISIIVWFAAIVSVAQTKTVYNAYKQGLSMRDKPDLQATV